VLSPRSSIPDRLMPYPKAVITSHGSKNEPCTSSTIHWLRCLQRSSDGARSSRCSRSTLGNLTVDLRVISSANPAGAKSAWHLVHILGKYTSIQQLNCRLRKTARRRQPPAAQSWREAPYTISRMGWPTVLILPYASWRHLSRYLLMGLGGAHAAPAAKSFHRA
jgi:hypothetical protein